MRNIRTLELAGTHARAMSEKKKTADRDFPSRFGRYLLLDRLASGGMAEVYRARSSTDGNRIIAIKCMLPALADDEEFANMFVDEAKLASQLQHPNIVQIYELGRFAEQLYIAMELINGRDLRAIVRKAKKRGKPLDTQFVAYVIAKAAEGLDYAHHKTALDGTPLRLVHRDVSPQNILVSYDGEVKVVDFGIAKADMRRTASRVGILKGKFAYMAPEQVKTGEVDGRTDIFALGAVLYETLAGRKLFFGESDYSILERVTNAQLPEEPQAWQYLPAGIAGVVRRAVQMDAAARYQEASHLAEALESNLIVDKTIYGPKQAREAMHELFAEEIAENERQLRAFATVADLVPSEMAAEVSDELDRRDFSIVTGDAAGAAADAQRLILARREAQASAAVPEPTRFDVDLAAMADDSERDETRIMESSAAPEDKRRRTVSKVTQIETRPSRVIPPTELPPGAGKKPYAVWAVSASFVLALILLVVIAIILARNEPQEAPPPPVIAETPTPEPKPPVDPAPEPEDDPSANLPKYGFLSVRTKDGRPARVYIDRREVGPAPIVRRRVILGSHSVRIVDRSNLAKSTEVKVTERHTKKAPLDVVLTP